MAGSSPATRIIGEGAQLSGNRSSASTQRPLIIVVHSRAHAIAALNAAATAERAVTLASAPGAGVYAGPGWFCGIVEAAREAVPGAQFSAILDCGDEPGAALAAMRAGVECIVFIGRADVGQRLAEIAAQHGARVESRRLVPDLDLADDFFASEETLRQRCAEVLAPVTRIC
jgi:hypothetical protein